MLWTNEKNKSFDDVSVYRFLLEPGNIFINGTDSSFKITGAEAQQEKEEWDAQKEDLISYKINLRKSGNPFNEIEMVNEKIKIRD